MKLLTFSILQIIRLSQIIAILSSYVGVSIFTKIADPLSVAPCHLEIAPFYSSDIPAKLPEQASFPLSPRNPELDQTLLQYSEQYALRHFDQTSGMLYDSSGQLNTRDTAISTLLWAELGYIERAQQALTAVLDAQYLVPTDMAWYGNFPVHPGETPTDSNWSAFIGSFLLVFRDRYEETLTPQLRTDLLTAIRAASIHRTCIRHELHGATNINFLSAFVLLRGGEVLANSDLAAFGKHLWQNIVLYTVNNGIAEYNSPNYLKVDLYGLGFLASYVQDEQVKLEAERIRLLFWWSITQHYHLPTRQLAGPFSRTYSDRMIYELTGIQAFLVRESGGAIPLGTYSGDENNEQTLHAFLSVLINLSWPDKWTNLALSPPGLERQFRERTRIVATDGTFQQITTYFTKRLAVGSVNTDRIHSSQRRPIIAHAASERGDEVGVFYVTAPISGAWIKSVQHESSILGVIQFNEYESDSSLECRLQWYGTQASLPHYTSNLTPTYNDWLKLSWMDIPVWVQIAPSEAVRGSLQIEANSQEAAVSLIWKAVPLQVPFEDATGLKDTRAMVAFALFFDTSEEKGGITLSSITATEDSVNGIHHFIWASPNGLLELKISTTDPWYVREFVGGEPVSAHPLTPADR